MKDHNMTQHFDPASVTVPQGLFLGDAQAIAGSGGDMEVTSPSDPNLRLVLNAASVDDVDRAVQAARVAQRSGTWISGGPRARAQVLRRWADLVEADANRIAELEAVVSARLYPEVIARDIKVVAGVLRYFGEMADKVDGSVTATSADSLSLSVHEPHGVVAAIAPWNFPIILAAWKFAPALAAGNAVVLKPSELTPFATLRIAELATQAGLPKGMFNIVVGDGRVGEALVRHPDVDYVTFTGSTATGARIMASAAETGLKPVSLELGGKGAHLVFDDVADLDRLAGLVARGITYNSGQVCFAGARLVVQKGVRDALLEKVLAHMAALRAGPTWEAATTLPPISTKAQANRIAGLVRGAMDAGATALCGGGVLEGPNDAAFFQPTVLHNVPRDNAAYVQEIFGPVLIVEDFTEPDEGAALASHPLYGLTSSVWTQDINRALNMARKIESGTVWINDWGRRMDFTSPFGGYKQSGIGKDMGRPGYEKYLKSKSIWIEM
jgi:aldehyde dehydrogenase (NAD+)